MINVFSIFTLYKDECDTVHLSKEFISVYGCRCSWIISTQNKYIDMQKVCGEGS